VSPALPLPPAAARQPQHTRKIEFQGYRRDDGLWDIEGELCDTKSQPFHLAGDGSWAPGEPIHHMRLRVTIDNDLVVHDLAVAMDSVPHAECPPAQAHMHRMIGCRMGRGWRQAIERNLGGIQGCAHLRELLFNMATAAFQTLPGGLSTAGGDQPPLHLGQCTAWDFNGTVVQRHHPMFFQWKPPTDKAPSQPPESASKHE